MNIDLNGVRRKATRRSKNMSGKRRVSVKGLEAVLAFSRKRTLWLGE